MSLSDQEFGKLAIAEIDGLARVAAGLTANAAEAEDLVQETYLRALAARESFELRRHGMRPWLLRIMHNVHVTRSARAARAPVATDPTELQWLDASAHPFPALSAELDDTLRRAMEALPGDLRSALVLWAVDELSYKEMAEILEIPIGTVMSRLHRARHVLARKLKETAPEMTWGAAGRYG